MAFQFRFPQALQLPLLIPPKLLWLMKLLWQLILRPLLPPSLIDYPIQLPYTLAYFVYQKLLPYPRWGALAYFTGVLRGSIFASLEVKLRSLKMYFFPFP
jgi:hypothetical protein